jgi:sugar/nucleoside kinase (ribokinase family)
MSEPEFDVVTIGDMCVDLIVNLGDAEPRFGQVEQWVSDYFLEMGGAACIFACQAAKLGLRVAILGRVGNDPFGRLVVGRLQESGVDTRYVSTERELQSGLGIALCRKGGDRAILTYGGSLNAVYPGDITDTFLRSGRHLHYASYYLQTNLLPAAPAILRRAKELGLTVSLDTNWDPAGRWEAGLRSALAAADLFFPNDREALAISGAGDLASAAAALFGLGPTVAVKLGERGAYVQSAAGSWMVPVLPVEQPVDTVGAGDSFDAGFVAGWLCGLPAAECAALGNACGRATTLARGGIQGQPTARQFPYWAAGRVLTGGVAV